MPPIPDEELGRGPEVLDAFSLVPELAKYIENAGQAYARLQGKFFRADQRAQMAQGGTDKKGRKIVVADSSDEEEEKQRNDDSDDQADLDQDEAKYG